MSVTSGPNIIKDGLVLYFDVANLESYPRGLTLFDISGRGRNATLTGGMSFSQANGGSLVLNGTSGYIDINHQLFPLNAFTYDLWFKPSNNDTIKIFWMGEMQLFFSTVSKNIYRRWYNSGLPAIAFQESFTEDYNSVWTNVVWTVGSYVDTVYINATQVGPNRNTTIASPTLTNYLGQTNSGTLIGRDEEAIYQPFSVASVKVYSKVLSQAQITRNFNAARSRFGI